MSGLSVNPRAFQVPRHRLGRGTTFRYTLSEPARVVFRIARKLKRGYRIGLRPVGRFAERATQGPNRKRFSGRLGMRLLRPGHYRATLVARDAAGHRSRPRYIDFRVLD